MSARYEKKRTHYIKNERKFNHTKKYERITQIILMQNNLQNLKFPENIL